MPKPGFFDFDELMTASGRCATSTTPRGYVNEGAAGTAVDADPRR
jgi:hypothetical protein